LRGVGPELARKFAMIDVTTPAALAATYPRDYRDWRVPIPIATIVREALARGTSPSEADSSETILVGEIVRVGEIRSRVAVVTADLVDPTGRIAVTWFGRRGLAGKLTVGDRLFVHGRAALKRTRGAAAVSVNALHHAKLAPGEPYVGEIVPVYAATKELPSRTIATTIERNADALAELVRDDVPPEVARAHGYAPLAQAWREVHKPPTMAAAEAARERLIFGEFFTLALDAALARARDRARGDARPLEPAPDLLARFEATLAFSLTGAQRRAIADVWADMAGRTPMNRLVQGDVGSGKTTVAAAAIVLAASRGVQSALMAPTELLAMQHARKLAPLLLPLGITVDALFGSLGARDRAAVRARLESGACDLVVGTHALIVEGVAFRNLGLAIIDEQHRFGVAQRAALREKSRAPHTLHMTATPIPRTLAQTKYADLDLTTVDELPPGRTPIETYVVGERRKAKAYDFVRRNVARGRQAYVVVPAIDDAEATGASAMAELEHLRADVFPDLRVALLHGRLPPREKDAAMAAFAAGETDVLLATTVVEVGVDVPNASVMVVLDAHRFGLAQLHQLRGRVGRGVARSYCVLVAPDDRAHVRRLEILANTTDGFAIAEADLRLRGEGEFAGLAQAGGGRLLGSIVSDFALYERAKFAADAYVVADPDHAERLVAQARAAGDASARRRLLSS